MTTNKDHHFRELLDDGFDDCVRSKLTYRASASDDRVYTSKWRMMLRRFVLGIIFYLRLCVNEIKKKLFNFLIGAASITITVFVAATISTIVDNAPFVILKEAENSCGQYDIMISPRIGSGPYINYTLTQQTLLRQERTASIAQLSTSRHLFNNTQSLFFTPQCIQSIDIPYFDETNECKLKFEQTAQCEAHSSMLWIIDFEREQFMKFGAAYPQHLIPGKGEIVVNKMQIAAFNIRVGDVLLLSIDLSDDNNQQSLLWSFIRSAAEESKNKMNAISAAASNCSRILIKVKIIAIIDELSFGKFGSDINLYTFLMNIKYFMPYLQEQSANNSALQNPIFSNLWTIDSLQQLSTHIFFNLPHRISIFLTLNYQFIQSEFAKHASNIVFFLG